MVFAKFAVTVIFHSSTVHNELKNRQVYYFEKIHYFGVNLFISKDSLVLEGKKILTLGDQARQLVYHFEEITLKCQN